MESFKNILFSSVVGGPSFVHSPHIPSPAKLNSCSYYLSILDPNMELPELSTKDIDDLLCDSNFYKSNKETAIGNFENSFSKSVSEVVRPVSLIIDSKNGNEKIKKEPSSIASIDDNVVSLLNDSSVTCGILYKCIVRSCNINFKSKSDQMTHFFTEHKDKTITCVSCKSIFKSKYSLQKHFLVNPDCKLKNTYRCNIEQCDKYFFSQNNLEIHLSKQHCVPSISCLNFSCGLKFFDNASRDDHVKTCHSEMKHHCVPCDKVFFDRDLFEKHDLKFHQNIYSRPSGSLNVFSCSGNVCEDYFGSPNNTRLSKKFGRGNETENMEDKMLICDVRSISALAQNPVMENHEIKIMYACPLPECSVDLNSKTDFQSHFLKHFTGELPGDINSLLPPDPPVPGLELHSKTFEANVDYIYQRDFPEETNLVQALDLVPDKLLQSLEWLDDERDSSSSNSCLTSALILPSTDTTISRNLSARNSRRRKNPYQDDSVNLGNVSGHLGRSTSERLDDDNNNRPKKKYKATETMNLSLSYSLLSSIGSCARTCPKVNTVMANLIKRRRVFLKERVGMMLSCDSVLYQPAARQPALKEVVHQIFNSQQLPNKYEEIVNVDSSEL